MNVNIKLKLVDVAGGKISGVYKMTFDCGKFYIGSAVNIRLRAKNHTNGIRTGFKSQKNILSAGDVSSEVILEILEICEVDNLANRETYHISTFLGDENLLNRHKPVASKSNGKSYGNKQVRVGMFSDDMKFMSEHTVKELSNKFDVHVVSIRRSLKLGNKIKGVFFFKINEQNEPIIPQPRPRKKIKRPEHFIHPSSKAVNQYTISGEFIKQHKSIATAARHISVDRKEMQKHVNRGLYKLGIKGYIFSKVIK
jgi:group I intron endonuclease